MFKKIYEFIRFILIFGLFFALIFGVLNYPALTNYMSHYQEKGEHVVNLHNKNIFTKEEAKTVPKSLENHLVIPVLNIDVPIIWESEEGQILSNLKNGVVRYPGTALPGEVGNIFIVGHSSNYWWDKGQYKSIFAALSQLKKDDEILINYQNTQYIYQVSETKVVLAKDTEVLKSNSESILSLMTCTPVGTSWKRLVVIAKQIWPDPGLNLTKEKSQIETSKLPTIR